MAKWLDSVRQLFTPKPDYNRIAADIFEKKINSAYDGYRTTPQNEKYWAHADYLSPQSANLLAKRKVLRSRSRYECVESNSYARGMVLTKVGDVIGRGPKLQINTENREFNSTVEEAWNEWSKETNFPEKLRTMCSAKIVDGESFAERITNLTLDNPVKMDLRLSEADLWTDPRPNPMIDPRQHDGILYDKSGNPIRYMRMKFHPGDSHFLVSQMDVDMLSPDEVIHWFRTDRPDQRRGIPEFTSALPLFAELRRWIMATLAAAETAAEFAAIIESQAQAFSESPDTIAEQVTIPINHRSMMALPAGWTMKQFKAENPNSNFEMFEEKILTQIARCLQMPLNIAMGSSRNHNFASGRLDYLLWWNACDIDRQDCEASVLDKVFAWWLEEARLVPGFLSPIGRTLKHTWVFPERRPIDEVAHAKATEALWNIGLLADSEYLIERGIDPDDHYENLEKQNKARAKIDKMFPRPGVQVTESHNEEPTGGQSGGQPKGRFSQHDREKNRRRQ